jgi:16S rRNA (uracil1498-N3)-methyltransferase
VPDLRAHCPHAAAAATELTLAEAESHHLVTVHRARAGDLVTAFDGRGREWTCAVATPDRRAAVLRVTATRLAPPLPCALTLAQAIPKGGAMEDIVRQATELGAAAVLPVLTARTEVHLEGERAGRKSEKWLSTAIEAAKQCGNPFVPAVPAPVPLAALLTAPPAVELRLIASLHPNAHPLRAALADFRAAHGRPPHSALWLVGPEGDFTPAEMAAATDAGFAPVTLGPLVLRCVTAATCALGILRHETG